MDGACLGALHDMKVSSSPGDAADRSIITPYTSQGLLY